MDILTYEAKQLERFDTLFNHILTSYAISNESKYQLKATRIAILNLKEQIEDVSKQYEFALVRYSKDYTQQLAQIHESYQQNIHNEQQRYESEIATLKADFEVEIANTVKHLNQIHSEFTKIQQKTNIDIYRALLSMKQAHQNLDFEFEKVKKEYQESINQLENKKTITLLQIEKSFDQAIKENYHDKATNTLKFNETLQKLSLERNHEQTDFDESIRNTKSIFNRSTIKLNQKIRDIQKEYQKIIANSEAVIQNEIEDKHKEIVELKNQYEQKEKDIESNYALETNRILERLNQMESAYNSKRDDLIKEVSKEITIHNSNLANYKEVNIEQLKNLEKNTQQNRLNIDKSHPDYYNLISEVNKNYLKEKRQFEIDVEKEIKNTRIQNKASRKIFQHNLLLNDYDYIIQKETLHLKQNYKKQEKYYLLEENRTEFQLKITSLNETIRMLEKQLFLNNQTNKEKQNLTIYPYEALALLSREIQDSELNYRNLENNHEKQINSFLEHKENLSFQIDDNQLTLKKNVLNLEKLYNDKQTNMVCYFDIEYEKNGLLGQESILKSQKQEFELQYNKQELEFFHYQEIEREKRITNQKITNFNQKLHAQIKDVKDNKEAINHESNLELAKSKHTELIGIKKAKRIIDTSLNETQRQRRLFDAYFQMLLSMHVEYSNFNLLVRDIYQTSPFDDFKHAIPILNEILDETLKLNVTILEDIKDDSSHYYQDKIDELTAYKYMNLKESILSDYETEHKVYTEELDLLSTQVKSSRDALATTLSQIATIENHNADLTSTILLIQKQIHNIRPKLFNKQNQKTIKNLKIEIDSIRKDYKQNHAEIKHLKNQVIVSNLEMKSLEKNYKPLDVMLASIEDKKFKREKALEKGQYKEGRVYYDALSDIATWIEALSHFYKSHTNYVKETLKLLENMVSPKDFNAKYPKLLKETLKLRNYIAIYHQKGILLCDRQHQAIQKEQLRIIKEYEKSYLLTEQNILQTTQERNHKVAQKLEDLNSYHDSFLKVQNKQLLKEIKVLNIAHEHKIKQIDEQIELAIRQTKNAYIYKEDLLSASKENTLSVWADKDLTLKNQIDLLQVETDKLNKDLNRKVSVILMDIKQAEMLLNEKIGFLSEKEKLGRQRIFENLSNNKTRGIRQYHAFLDDIHLLKLHNEAYVINKEKTILSKKSALKRKYSRSLKRERFHTDIVIFKSKRKSKKLWREKQDYLNE